MVRSGLQPERTSLAWNRTALAGLALLGAVIKVAADHADARTVVCAAIVVAHTFIVAACAAARGHAVTLHRRSACSWSPTPARSPRA